MNKNFLSKKSWHTGSLKHIEKVWKAEQRHEEETKKLLELQRQLQHERELKDLNDIKRNEQRQQGLIKDDSPRRLDWMYEPIVMGSRPTAEEYLLGKPYIEPDQLLKTDTKSVESLGLFQQNKSNTTPANSASEIWNRLREDPLLTIKQKELAARDSIRKNPVRMSLIRQALLDQQNKSPHKKEKGKEKHKHKDKDKSRDKTKKRKRGDSDSDSEPKKKREHSSSSSSLSTSISKSAPTPAPTSTSTVVQASPTVNTTIETRNRDGRTETTTTTTTTTTTRKEWQNHRHRSGAKPRMTDEERAQLLEQMTKDAAIHGHQRISRFKHIELIEKQQEEEERALVHRHASKPSSHQTQNQNQNPKKDHDDDNEDDDSTMHARPPSFLAATNKQIYNESSGGVEDRLKRNIHYRQKGDMDESGIFKTVSAV